MEGDKGMVDDEDTRLSFRITKTQEKDMDNLMVTGRWKTRSELIRAALWLGFKELKKGDGKR